MPTPDAGQLPDRWVMHDGSSFPRDAHLIQAVKFRGGVIIEGGDYSTRQWQSHWVWRNPPSGLDILAYLQGPA